MRSWLVLITCAVPAVASADPVELHSLSDASTYDIGFRIGGYGFRREGDTSANSWNECRMNGLGVFASRSLRGPFFAEAGLDAYFSSDFIQGEPSTDVPIDRMSALVSTAIGVRSDFTSWLRGYAQVGAGLELTRLSVPYGDDLQVRENKVMPEGFFGVGFDLRVSQGLYVGASMRMLVMGNFDYAEHNSSATWGASMPPSEVFDASPDLAAQGQFYVRRDLR
jgi:hypothetical protein